MTTIPLSARVGHRLAQLRMDRGWTLAVLATQTGIPTSTLNTYELGQRTIPLEQLARLAAVYDVAPATLLIADPQLAVLVQAVLDQPDAWDAIRAVLAAREE